MERGAAVSLGLDNERLSALAPPRVHRLLIDLAELVVEQGPPEARAQLELARAFIEGRASAAALREARQDCWSYVGSLACGCSISDSASAHAILTSLETDESALGPSLVLEQLRRVAQCGVSESKIMSVLAQSELV